ncbi:MAG: hypothetical protein ACYDBQ_02225 [Thermoplasmatota archaeon]
MARTATKLWSGRGQTHLVGTLIGVAGVAFALSPSRVLSGSRITILGILALILGASLFAFSISGGL